MHFKNRNNPKKYRRIVNNHYPSIYLRIYHTAIIYIYKFSYIFIYYIVDVQQID